MLKLSESKLVSQSDMDFVVFISDDIPRITRKTEVNPYVEGRSIQKVAELFQESKYFSRFFFPDFLILNSYFGRKIYNALELKFWQSIELDLAVFGVLSKFNSVKERQFLHIPMDVDYEYISENKKTPRFRLSRQFPGSKFAQENSIGPLEINDLKEIQKFYFIDDPHPNAQGAIWIAKEIANRIQKICNFSIEMKAL